MKLQFEVNFFKVVRVKLIMTENNLKILSPFLSKRDSQVYNFISSAGIN